MSDYYGSASGGGYGGGYGGGCGSSYQPAQGLSYNPGIQPFGGSGGGGGSQPPHRNHLQPPTSRPEEWVCCRCEHSNSASNKRCDLPTGTSCRHAICGACTREQGGFRCCRCRRINYTNPRNPQCQGQGRCGHQKCSNCTRKYTPALAPPPSWGNSGQGLIARHGRDAEVWPGARGGASGGQGASGGGYNFSTQRDNRY